MNYDSFEINTDFLDLQRVIERTLVEAKKKYPHLKYKRLHSAYRKFDPVRGMDYQLHFTFEDNRESSGKSIIKRYKQSVPHTPCCVPLISLIPSMFQFRGRQAAGSSRNLAIAVRDREHSNRYFVAHLRTSNQRSDGFRGTLREDLHGAPGQHIPNDGLLCLDCLEINTQIYRFHFNHVVSAGPHVPGKFAE